MIFLKRYCPAVSQICGLRRCLRVMVLQFEIDSDGGDVGLLEGAFTEASDEYSFSYGAVSDDDDFGHEIVFLCFFRGVHSDIMMLVVL